MVPPGSVRAGPCNLASIYGNCSAGGNLVLKNGVDSSAPISFTVTLSPGHVRLRFAPNYFRFDKGCFVEYTSGLDAVLTPSFC